MAVSEEVDLSWVGSAAGALEAPGLRRRFIYPIPSPPCVGPIGCVTGVCVVFNYSAWGWLRVDRLGGNKSERLAILYGED